MLRNVNVVAHNTLNLLSQNSYFKLFKSRVVSLDKKKRHMEAYLYLFNSLIQNWGKTKEIKAFFLHVKGKMSLANVPKMRHMM